MIFKTIEDDSTLSGKRIISSLQARKIAQEEVNLSIQKHIAQLELDKVALTQLEQKIASGISYEEAYAQSMTKASVAAKEHAIQTKGLLGTTDTFIAKQKVVQTELKATFTASKLASAGVKALSTAFNMFSGMAIMWGITKIVEGFEYLSKSAERAKEKLAEIQTELSDNNTTYQSNRNTLIGLKDEYDTLTKKAKSLGGAQNLANDEYERYQSITSQILGITPKLTSGWDDEGKAISNKNNLIQASIDLLDEEYEKSLRNNTTKSKNEDVASGIITELDEFNKSIDTTTKSNTMAHMRESFLDELEKLEHELGITEHDLVEKMWVYFDPLADPTDFMSDHVSTYEELGELIGKDYDKLANSFADLDNPIYELFSDEVIDDMIRNANEYFYESQRIIDERNTFYQKYKDQLNWNAQAAQDNTGKNAYKQLTDNGKTLINEYINGLDYASIKSKDDFVEMANDVQKFVKLLASNNNVGQLVEDVFTPEKDDETFEQYINRVKKSITDIQQYCNENYIDIPINFTMLNELDKLKSQIAYNLASITGSIEITNQGEYQNAMAETRMLEEYTKDFTQAEWERWLEVTNGIKGAINSIKAYEESLESVSDVEVALDATKAITSLKDLSDELDNVANALKTFYEKDEFSINDLDSIADYFLGLEDVDDAILISVNNALGTLMDTNATSYEQAAAIDALADSYLKTSTVLDTLTESNADLMKTQLKVMGIVNAEEIVDAKLAQTKAELAANNDKLVQDSINLSTVTYEEIEALLVEQEVTDLAAKKMAELAFEKQFVNEVTIDPTADINNIYQLAKAAGATAEQLRALATAKSVLAAAEHDSSIMNTDSYKEALDLLESVANGTFIENAESKIDIQIPEVDYEKSIEDLLGDGSGGSDTEDNIDWVEKLISRIQRTITNLGKTVSATYKQWSTRNNALAQEMQAVNQEISIQQKAYEAYMAKANSIPLPEFYKELVRNGGYRIEDITDEGLRDQINSFQEWYEKALSCEDAIEDLRASLAELAMTKFDNISAQFDNQMSMSNHNISMLEGYISQAEAVGMIVSEEYYKAMIEQQEANVSQLKDKYSSLLSAFDEAVKNGSIEKYSEDWYEMLESINGVELEIQSATTELIEFNQALQQLSWATFDRMQGYINNITSEAEFLIDMLDEEDLFDDNGNMSDKGLAVQGLHAVNYNVYMAQAQDYADEIAKLNEEIAKDPYDMELIDRRNELIQSQQDAIANAMKEKEAILALIEEGYNKMLESLQELIDKRKEALQAEKNLYDYQNSISEKTDNIAKLRKQLQAYAGDNSESAKAKIQELQTQLEEAEKDLQETEYDKWLSDQEEMLDNLYSQTEDWVNERLDNIDVLLEEAINATNKNAETISNTIREISDGYGYTLTEEMETIWDYEAAALNGITDIVSLVGDKLTTVNFALDSIGINMQNMINSINNFATQNANSIAALQQAIISGQPSSSGSNPAPTTPSNPSGGSGGGNSGGTGSSGSGNSGDNKSYALADRAMKLAIMTNLTKKEAEEKAKNFPNCAIVEMDKIDKQGRWLPPYYANGTKNAKRGLGIFGEAGDEILVANDGSILLSSGATLYPFQGGETVFNAKDTSEILKNSLVPLSANDILGKSMTHNVNGVVRNTNGDINQDINVSFSLPNVTDANTLITELQHNKRFEKVIQSMTADSMLGKNSLNKYKF